VKAQETIIVARLADHYEKLGVRPDESFSTAEHDYFKFKREAPKLWQRLWDDRKMDSRAIGDWLSKFIDRWLQSGMSLRNFAADELDSLK
jgi:hypothetical protein